MFSAESTSSVRFIADRRPLQRDLTVVIIHVPSLPLSIAGAGAEDFTFLLTSFSLALGTQAGNEVCFPLSITDDSIVEAVEDFTLTLSQQQLDPVTVVGESLVVFINDNDCE